MKTADKSKLPSIT